MNETIGSKTTSARSKSRAVRPPQIAVKPFNLPGPSRQVRFYQLLVIARKQWLMDALSEALKKSNPNKIKEQIIKYVPAKAQKTLAAAGIRDEHIFPLPTVLEFKPSLIGYYRLLLGVSQKAFYKSETGLSVLKSMEKSGICSHKQLERLPEFCEVMAQALTELVQQIPNITKQDIRELPLLTYGAQLQGSNNTVIGKKAMQDVFMAFSEIVKHHILNETSTKLTVKNAAGRTVLISRSHDPDVAINEQVGASTHKKVAIEVKGGTDISNAHNRAGEAEKSHLKAKGRGYPEFWTIISKTGLSMAKLKSESQTTNHWFDIAEVLARRGTDWDEFRQRVVTVIGIPLTDR